MDLDAELELLLLRLRQVLTQRKADEYGKVDPATGQKNYVNPWEERIDIEKDLPPDVRKKPSGRKFRPYTGPVYKQVPVVEGLEFPLDPNLYYPPLEPPPPGAKWGDGRSPDGNWYMDVEDEKVQYWQGVGKRKTACAIVRIVKGNGQFIVNGKDAITYFNHYPYWWLKACEPLAALSQKNKFDIIAKSFGGGVSGQAGAIRLALARAMQDYNFNWRPLMKKAKYLTRDYRMVEPKKPGQPKARRKTPFHKR
ncbi:rpsI [Symbiodinium necroappetens]|uniref:RpsI protein n=1 Tax=Symbiodinium necroappetens TaxID=1628268 RepID=A0A812LXL7_9DINO|nr:rpsI [Symbiodinium necroappetens]